MKILINRIIILSFNYLFINYFNINSIFFILLVLDLYHSVLVRSIKKIYRSLRYSILRIYIIFWCVIFDVLSNLSVAYNTSVVWSLRYLNNIFFRLFLHPFNLTVKFSSCVKLKQFQVQVSPAKWTSEVPRTKPF